jgi:hypothetical protein
MNIYSKSKDELKSMSKKDLMAYIDVLQWKNEEKKRALYDIKEISTDVRFCLDVEDYKPYLKAIYCIANYSCLTYMETEE